MEVHEQKPAATPSLPALGAPPHKENGRSDWAQLNFGMELMATSRSACPSAHALLTTERHRMAQDDTRRHRTTRRAGICAWLQQP